MRRFTTRLITILAVIASVLGLSVSPVSAGQARFYACMKGPSNNGVDVILERNSTGEKARVWVQTPGCIGEGTGRFDAFEAEGYHIDTGWCGSHNINSQGWSTYRRGPLDVITFPGETWGGFSWRTDIRHWDC